MLSICIFIDLCVTVDNTKPFSIATETLLLLPLALLSTDKIIRTAINSNNVIKSSDTVPDIV